MCCEVRSADRVSLGLAVAAIVLMALIPATVPVAVAQPVRVMGTLTALQVVDVRDRRSPGRIAVGAQEIIVPATVAIDVGTTIMTMQELFTSAPIACRARNETGLVETDVCRSRADATTAQKPPATAVRVVAARDADGNLVASKVTFAAASAVIVHERSPASNPLR
jgi:hypothetical protein